MYERGCTTTLDHGSDESGMVILNVISERLNGLINIAALLIFPPLYVAVLPAALIVLRPLATLAAQTPGAALTGAVRDERGAAVANVDLMLVDAATGAQRRAVSSDQGGYVFADLPPGTYALLVSAVGFSLVRLEGITLASGDQRSLAVTLKVASLAESISVSAADGYTRSSVTIGKTSQSLREIPQSVSVITRQRIEDQNLRTLDQALAQTTGITVLGAGGATPVVGMYSRGFALQTIQRDGVPSQIGNNWYGQPDLAIYDRVEVIRGADGLFSGAGQPGGVVNLARKRALDTPQFHVTATAGSWNNYRIESDLTGKLNASGRLRGRIVGVYQDQKYFFDVPRSRNSGLFYGRLEYDLAPRTILSVGGAFEKRNTPYTNGVPSYTTGADLHLDRATNLSAAWSDWSFTKPEMFAEVEHRWNDIWKAKLAVTHVRENSDYKAAAVWGAVDPATLLGPSIDGAGIEERRGGQSGLDLTVNGGFGAFGRRHEVVFGLAYAQLNVRKSAAYPDLGPYPIDVFHFDPYSIPEPVVTNWDSRAQDRNRQYGYYGMARWRLLRRLTVATGGRVSSYSFKTRDLTTGAITQDYRKNGVFTPYGGLVFDLSPVWSLYASYTDIFQVQNRYTYLGALSPPIVGANYEGGIKGQWLNGAVNASFALFRVDQTNRAQLDPTHPAPCAGSPDRNCYIAEGAVRSQGLEGEISGRLMTGLDISSGYTYNTTRYVKDRTATGDPSANEGQSFSSITPTHIARVWINYRLPIPGRRVDFGAGINAQSSSYLVSQGSKVEQPGYAILGARINYAINDRLSVSLNINNLLDHTYYHWEWMKSSLPPAGSKARNRCLLFSLVPPRIAIGSTLEALTARQHAPPFTSISIQGRRLTPFGGVKCRQ